MSQVKILCRVNEADSFKINDNYIDYNINQNNIFTYTVNYHFISEQKSHFFAHSFRKPSPLF